MTLATRFDEWALQHEEKGRQEGIEKGIEKGVVQGEVRLLQRLLIARFGPLSQATLAQLAAASVAELETWTDRFLNARSLADVFQPR